MVTIELNLVTKHGKHLARITAHIDEVEKKQLRKHWESTEKVMQIQDYEVNLQDLWEMEKMESRGKTIAQGKKG